jgi:hypothetical protein
MLPSSMFSLRQSPPPPLHHQSIRPLYTTFQFQQYPPYVIHHQQQHRSMGRMLRRRRPLEGIQEEEQRQTKRQHD